METFFKSPNGRFSVRLHQPRTYQPQASQRSADALNYFRTIWLTDLRYSGRYFTGPGMWSSDSRYFAAEEWVVTTSLEDSCVRRDCRLVVFDVLRTREAQLAVVQGGHVAPVAFEGECLRFDKSLPGQASPEVLEISMSQVANWSPVGELS